MDRAQILQVFQNLVVNAIQAMPPPPHRPRVQLRARNLALADGQVAPLPAGDYVEFEVRDNGAGIPPQYVAKIFDPFFTTKKHGTGLGLATVLSIVRRYGGQIGLDTAVGVGTAFTTYGTCGIKVWIFKGEILEHDPMAQDKRLADEGGRSGSRREG